MMGIWMPISLENGDYLLVGGFNHLEK